MGGKRKGGFFFRWMKSDLPDREENPSPVLLLAVHKTSPSLHRDKPGSPDCFTLPCTKQYDDLAPRTEHHRHLFSQLNERFRKTLSLDSRTGRNPPEQDVRPKSMVNAPNFTLNNCSNNLPNTSKTPDKNSKKKRFRPKSFFSLETFLDSRRSEASSVDDFSSSKYCKFYLDSSAECSPVLKGRTTPDLLDVPAIIDGQPHIAEESQSKRRLEKLENHLNKLKNSRQNIIEPSVHKKENCLRDDAIYIEPIYESLTASQTTLVIGSKTDNGNLRQSIDCETRLGDSSGLSNSSDFHIQTRPNKKEKLKHRRKTPSPITHRNSSECLRSDLSNNNKHSERFIPIKPAKDQDIAHENSQSPVPYCNGFTDCSNALRNACNTTDCSNSLLKSRRNCCKEGTPSSAYEIHITEDDILNNEKTKNLVVKAMDKSVDSIGSCSLDVDAENTDFSDTTSGSLNILTPSSTTSHLKDFTSKFHERATPGLRPDLRGLPLKEENFITSEDFLQTSQSNQYNSLNNSQPRKPSYLHLACSVNGYSNLTTYDSTLRQKLNKSREHSPARLGNISSFVMLRNCPDEAMTQRLNMNSTNTNTNTSFFKTSFSETSISSQNVLTYLKSNGQTAASETHTSKSYHVISNGAADESPSKSFIQQRVERLYGPGALAQGFFNQKKQLNRDNDKNVANGDASKVTRMEHGVVNKSQNGVSAENTYSNSERVSNGQDNSETVLPVLRHLRPEFRAQLPMVSPKRSPLSKISDNSHNINIEVNKQDSRLNGSDVVDRGNVNGSDCRLSNRIVEENKIPVVTIIPITRSESCTNNNISSNGDLLSKTGVLHKNDEESYENIPVINPNVIADKCVELPAIETLNIESINLKNAESNGESSVKNEVQVVIEDGHFFLKLHHAETIKLEELAKTADRDLEEVQNSPDVSEEVRGFLRVAAGKARLLASEKMKQFEGLCFKNINGQPDSKFHTTIQDLRGFWDMVYLQVEDIQLLFEQIKEMKASNWKELPTTKRPVEAPKSARSQIPTSKKNKQSETSTAKSAAITKKRDEQRKALIEAKRRAAKMQQNSSVEIFANSPPPQILEQAPETS